MIDLTPRQLTKDELLSLEQGFWQLYSDPAKRDEMWNQLNTFFSTKTVKDDEKYYYTFFRWYTELNWKGFNLLTFDQVVSAFERQTFMALALGYDPIDLLLFYCVHNTDTTDEAVDLFGKAKKAFLASPAYFGRLKGEVFTIKTILPKMGFDGGRAGETTMDRAKVHADIMKMIALPADYSGIKRYPVPTEDELVNNFAELVDFFYRTNAEDLPDLFVHYQHDDWFAVSESEGVVPGQSKPADVQPVDTKTETKEEVSSEVVKEEKVEVSKPVEAEAVPKEKTKTFPDVFGEHKKDFTSWISEKEARDLLLSWLKTFVNADVARKSFAVALQRVLPELINDIEMAGSVVELDDFLSKNGFKGEEFLYFDGELARFQWNAAYL